MLRACRLLSGRGHGVKVGQEVVNRRRVTNVVGKLLAQKALSEIDGVLAHFLAQLCDYLLTLGSELLLTGLDDSCALVVGLRSRLGDDLLTLNSGLIADLGGFGAGLGELAVVLLESGLGLGLCGLGTLDAALNPVLPLGQDLLELRKNKLPKEEQDDDERNCGPDDIV